MSDDVSLGAHLDAFVSTLVETGRFPSEVAVLRAGVRLLQDREERLADLDRELDQGIADADAGRLVSVDEVRQRLRLRTGSLKTDHGR